jgi:hypothetical protein
MAISLLTDRPSADAADNAADERGIQLCIATLQAGASASALVGALYHEIAMIFNGAELSSSE